MVPGHEIIGRVAIVGTKVTRFKVGDAVGVGCGLLPALRALPARAGAILRRRLDLHLQCQGSPRCQLRANGLGAG